MPTELNINKKPFLEVRSIRKKDEKGFELSEISFFQNRNQNIAISGATGSGKSTCMKIIAGLIQPDAGNVFFDSKRVKGPEETLIPGHKGIAYLSQQFELRNNYKVGELLNYANELPEHQANQIYELCRIDHLLNRWTHELSGGEKQRIALARLLTGLPRLFLLDEPYTNLDMMHRQIMRSVLEDIGQVLDISFMMIAHDPADVLSWAHEILVLNKGSLVQKGSPKDLYFKPADIYTAGLFGKYNLVPITFVQHYGLKIEAESHLLLRPEQLRICTKNDNCMQGSVIRQQFMGAHFEISVQNESGIYFLKSELPGFETGMNLYFEPHPELLRLSFE